MTVAIAGLVCTLAVVLSIFVQDLGEAASLKARAQLAADAAALAAVAESGPYGSGAPEAQARRFAEANGARLVECRCEVGATAAQVEVAVDAVVAQARAVLDPEALAPASISFDRRGLHPLLERAVERLIDASRGRVRVISGYRSPERQAQLWADAVSRYGSAESADDWVAPPGRSMHERGLAVDLGGDLVLAAHLVRTLRLPLHRPLANEPWHFELDGRLRRP